MIHTINYLKIHTCSFFQSSKFTTFQFLMCILYYYIAGEFLQNKKFRLVDLL